MLLLSVRNSHVFTSAVVQAVIFILLDVVVLIHWYETVGSQLVVHNVEGIGKGLRH